MKREDAAHVLEIALEYGAKLDALVAYLQPRLDAAEYVTYRRAIGHVMGETLRSLINPVIERARETSDRPV